MQGNILKDLLFKSYELGVQANLRPSKEKIMINGFLDKEKKAT
jgi:hypothetical protein